MSSTTRPSHRDALLAAAQTLIRERGYADTSARDLVAASNTNLASIGYHFGSKEALLNEAIALAFEEWTRTIGQAIEVDPAASPLERVAISWRLMLDEFEPQRPYFVAFLEALARCARSDELRAQLAGHYQALREQVTELIAASLGSSLADDEAQRVAGFLIAICDGLMIQAFLDPERSPTSEQLADAMGKALAAAVGTNVPDAPL